MKGITKIAAAACLALPTPVLAVDFLDGKKLPEGDYLAFYPLMYSADDYNDHNGDTVTSSLGLTQQAVVLRYLNYTGDYVFNAILPVGRVEVDMYNADDSGAGDLILGGGVFVPNGWGDVVPVLQVKFDTGSYDQNNNVNFGSGQMDVRAEVYATKVTEALSIDLAAKYWFRLENDDTKFKPGDELYVEGAFLWSVNDSSRVGPTVVYMAGDDDEQNGGVVTDSAITKLSAGVQGVYQGPKVQYLFEVVADLDAENSAEGVFTKARIAFPF